MDSGAYVYTPPPRRGVPHFAPVQVGRGRSRAGRAGRRGRRLLGAGVVTAAGAVILCAPALTQLRFA
ncbi:hypothetical protein ACR820_15350 [Streptomyces netropsis]